MAYLLTYLRDGLYTIYSKLPWLYLSRHILNLFRSHIVYTGWTLSRQKGINYALPNLPYLNSGSEISEAVGNASLQVKINNIIKHVQSPEDLFCPLNMEYIENN